MGGNSDTPAAPDYAKLYQEGIDVYLRNLPRLLDTEAQTRATTDPQRIAEQQRLQELFGSTMYKQQLDALHQLDPESAAIRSQLGATVLSDLKSGYELPKDYQTQIETSVRGAQAARGNILGNSASLVESSVKGKAAADLYQQHIQNAGNFLSSPTPEQQLLAVQGVSPDRTMAYANPGAGTAGANFGLANYQNLLAQQQLQNQNNPWTNALTGAASGASAGSAAGGWGALIGGVAGGAAGYFSDVRLKEDVREIGKTASGIPLIVFRFIGSKIKRVGTRAQDVARLRPDAVLNDVSGFLKVRYDKLSDVPNFALEGENIWLHA